MLSNADGCGRFVSAVRRARDSYDIPTMVRELDTWAAQIAQAVAEDPHKTFSMQEHLDAVATLEAFLPERAAFIGGWLANTSCPVTSWPARP